MSDTHSVYMGCELSVITRRCMPSHYSNESLSVRTWKGPNAISTLTTCAKHPLLKNHFKQDRELYKLALLFLSGCGLVGVGELTTVSGCICLLKDHFFVFIMDTFRLEEKVCIMGIMSYNCVISNWHNTCQHFDGPMTSLCQHSASTTWCCLASKSFVGVFHHNA